MIEKKFTEKHFTMKINIQNDFAVIYEGRNQDYKTELVGVSGINRAYIICKRLNALFEEKEKLKNAIKSVKGEISTEVWEDVFEDLV